jgi:hypothetical protein
MSRSFVAGTELGPATYVSEKLRTGIDDVYSAVNVIAARRAPSGYKLIRATNVLIGCISG